MADIVVPNKTIERYQCLQRYVGWSEADAVRVKQVHDIVAPVFGELVADFYAAIEREPQAAKVITGGTEQIARLQVTLTGWLEELFNGPYDEAYVIRRWKVGWRHVEIGLDQMFADMALARLRSGLLEALEQRWRGTANELCLTIRSLCKLVDLDQAIIQDAYAAEDVRRQRQAQREHSEAAFRELVESAASLIVILRADHTIAYFNPFAEQVTGFAASAILGRDYFSIFLPERERQGVEQDVANVLAGFPTRGYENSVLCRDGSERWVVWNAQRLDDFGGAPALLAIGQDITDRREAEQRALQAERLAAIGQTVAGLAHESRNAFQRSQACLELLALELEDRPDELELVSRIQRALDHLHRLYEEVRDYAAPIKLDRQLCDLPHLWRDAWAHLELNRKEREITFLETTNDVDLRCHCDWFALGQVFRNVLENAIVACPDPGKIEVCCNEASIHDAPALGISIRDNGPGIPTETRGQVFDAFFSTKTKGTGLGMAIARRIVEAHGGQIELGDQTSGAEFIITLPRS